VLTITACVLVGLVAGWITGYFMILSTGSTGTDLLTGIIGATAAGVLVRMLGAGSTGVVVTMSVAALSALGVTFARNVMAARARPGWRHS